ncbi:MAG: hypothetical protein Q7J79_11510 [Gemmatimonadales bacterium]|nr:hypothetical protein [Gemmatimonadales bacterium]
MFLPTRDHHIQLADAARMTRRFRETRLNDEKGGAFHAAQVKELLDQPDCSALRYYHALEEDGRTTVVLVGVDARNDDLWDGVLLEVSIPCPPYCGLPNELTASERPKGKQPYRAVPLALPKRDHHITLDAAATMTRRYREAFGDRVKGGAYLAPQVRELLAQRDCLALRYYYALEAAKETLILVGVDPEGADLTDGVLLETTIPCPPYCGVLNSLNASLGSTKMRRLEVAVTAGSL